ncbi:MAG: tetratricopeptide repeat protein [Candidatus Acidiferrales bacterium]
MAQDIPKILDRARRNLEKNKLREAVTDYELVLSESPSHPEALMALADIHTRLGEPAVAAQYYGTQFDRLVEAGDGAKASAVFVRFLRPYPQPPDRLMRFATLLQKQNRASEAIEQFQSAADLYHAQKRDIEALACFESMAVLDPENYKRHVTLAENAERLRHADMAMRSYLRAGQLIQAGSLDEALEYFGRAHRLAPQDKGTALLFAEAKLRKGDAEGAAALLEPYAATEKANAFLALFGEALLRTGKLDEAREIFEAYYKQKPDSFGKLFELASAYVKADEDEKAASLLVYLKDAMRKQRRDGELMVQVDRLAAQHPTSVPIAEAIAKLYDEMNRETKYFDALVRLFDLYLPAGRVKEACETLDRLVDIDPYDYRNHERIERLQGQADPAFLASVMGRAAKAATVSTRTEGFTGAGREISAAEVAMPEEARAQQALEDLIVQVEIFLQYSLQSKAKERLERIAELFPGAEQTNERLAALYERANWWPKGSKKPAPPEPIPVAAAPPPRKPNSQQQLENYGSAPATSPSAEETHRDLAAIAEINRLMYRQPSPREVLATTAAEIGKHLRATRCLVVVGAPGEGAQITAEYTAPGNAGVGSAKIAGITSLLSQIQPDGLGGVDLQIGIVPKLKELGLESGLGVMLTDKETQAQSGALMIGDAKPRKWKPNESFFLQAIGDQLVLSVNHTRLRSLVRSLAVTDEKTGLLSRGAYIDCLLMESNRARTQGTSLSLIVIHVDRGGELLRQHGDAALDHHIEQVAKVLASAIRQTDVAVKYTSWSLAFILPDTSIENARALGEKLRSLAATVRPAWGAPELTITAIVAEASSRPGDETEDRVTEWINRAEAGLEEARQRGGNTLLAVATP